jgi:hypothetical protein
MDFKEDHTMWDLGIGSRPDALWKCFVVDIKSVR